MELAACAKMVAPLPEVLQLLIAIGNIVTSAALEGGLQQEQCHPAERLLRAIKAKTCIIRSKILRP